MFGPDKCGLQVKLHFIVKFKNPKTGEIGVSFLETVSFLNISRRFFDPKMLFPGPFLFCRNIKRHKATNHHLKDISTIKNLIYTL